MTVTVDLRHPTFKTFGDTVSPASSPSGREGTSNSVALTLLPLRLFLIAGWARAGVEKFISAQWWRGETLTAFAAEHESTALAPYGGFLDVVGGLAATPVAFVVMVMQLAIAVGLTTKRWFRLALFGGIFLNLHFVAAGAVDPSAFYLIMQIAMLLATTAPTALIDTVRPLLRRRATPRWRQIALSLLPAVAVTPLIPLIGTLAPAEVIDDPAMMLVFLGYLSSFISFLRH